MRSLLVVLVLAALSSAATAKSKTRFTRYRSWNSRMYPVWKDGDSRYKDCWTGGEVTFNVKNDAPTLTGAKATFTIDLQFPLNQTVLSDGQVVWARNSTVNGTQYPEGQAVYPDQGQELNGGVFPDGSPFTRISEGKKSRYVFVWKTWGRYWQVADGPSSSLTIGTDDVPLGSYNMELVIYHCRGKDKFIPLGYASTMFSITDQIPFALSLTQVNDINEADQSFIQNRAVAFSVHLHDPSQYLSAADITFNWNFGDNSGTLISRERSVTHTYLATGNFRPQVVVMASIPKPCFDPTTVSPIATTPAALTTEATDWPLVVPADDLAVATAEATDTAAGADAEGVAAEGEVAAAVPAPEDAAVDAAAEEVAIPAAEGATVLPVVPVAEEPAPVVVADTDAAAAAADVADADAAAAALAPVAEEEEATVDLAATVVTEAAAEAEVEVAAATEAEVEAVDGEAEVEVAAAAEAEVEVPAAAEPEVEVAAEGEVEVAAAADAEVEAVDGEAEVEVTAEAEVEVAAEGEVEVAAAADAEAEVAAAAEVDATGEAEVAAAATEAAVPADNAIVPVATEAAATEDTAAPAVPAPDAEAEILEVVNEVAATAVPAAVNEVAVPAEGEVAAEMEVEVGTEAAQVALVLAKRQAPELEVNDDCTVYRYGSFSTAVDIIEGIESAEITDVANVVTLTAEVEQNAVDLTITCQGSLPNEVCTVISDADCVRPVQTVCTAVAPSPECQMILRQFFNDSGVFCINVSLTNDVSLAVASARVSVTVGSNTSTAGTVAAVLGVMVLVCSIGTIALAYRRFKQYRPLREESSGGSVGGSVITSVPLLLWNLLSRHSPGESRPLLEGRGGVV